MWYSIIYTQIWTIYFLSGRHVYASSKTPIVYESWETDPPNLGGSHNPYCTAAFLNGVEVMVRWWSVNILFFFKTDENLPRTSLGSTVTA